MSDRAHPPEEVLFEYADSGGSESERAAVEQHLSKCDDCRSTVADLRKFVESLADEEAWWLVRDMGDASVRSVLHEHAKRLDEEDAEARRLLDVIVDDEYRFSYANVARKRPFRTGGVVRYLCDAAKRECDKKPRYALALAHTALRIADALPESYYPASGVYLLRGDARKDYATACRYLGDFAAAFHALDEAEVAYDHLLDSELPKASLSLARAIMLWDQGSYEPAVIAVRNACRQFWQRGAMTKFAEAKEVEAAILHRRGDIETACRTYMEVYKAAESTGDAEMRARAARSLGVASAERGHAATASEFLHLALQLYDALQQPAMVALTRWAIAWATLLAGEAEKASRLYPSIVAELSALGMKADAARAQLDLAEVWLILGRNEDVTATCTTLVSFFRTANMLTGALTAAAYLKEAATNRSLTRSHIETVRTYLRSLDRSPDLPFVPSPIS